jgi:hypothetical protein
VVFNGSDVPGELQTPVQKILFMAGNAKKFGNIGHGLFVVECLAGKYVEAEVTPVGEGVNADMAFGNDDKSGNTPIFRNLAVILKDMRLHNLGHVDHIRTVIQELVDEVQVRQLIITTSIAI